MRATLNVAHFLSENHLVSLIGRVETVHKPLPEGLEIRMGA